MNPKPLNQPTIYQSPSIHLQTDQIELSSEQIIEKYPVLAVEKETVAVIVQNKQGQLLLIQTDRHQTDFLGWEMPSSDVVTGESVIEVAQRAVWQATGYETTAHQHIYTYNPGTSVSNQVYHIVSAQSTKITGSFNRDEIEAMQWFSRANLQVMLDNGTIKDGFTLSSLLFYLNGFRSTNGEY